jgi:hypothetical protein
MTNLMSAEFIRRLGLPSRKTIRRRFQFGSNLVFQFRPPTEIGGYEMKPAKAG